MPRYLDADRPTEARREVTRDKRIQAAVSGYYGRRTFRALARAESTAAHDRDALHQIELHGAELASEALIRSEAGT